MIFVDALRGWPVPAEAPARPAIARARGRCCHLIGETPGQLRAFMRTMKLPGDWKAAGKPPRLLITPGMRRHALRLGAVELDPNYAPLVGVKDQIADE